MRPGQATRRGTAGVVAALVAAWLGLAPPPATGQPATPGQQPAGVYAGASVLFTSQPGTSPETVGRNTPLEGSGLGLSGLLGVGGRLGLEGQIVRAPELTGLVDFPTSGGRVTHASTFRDTLVSLSVRWRGGSSSSRRVFVEPLGGLTLAFGSGTLAQSYVPDSPASDPTRWELVTERRSLGIVGGLDVLVPVGRRLAAGGLFRLHRLVWNDERNLDALDTGLGRWVLQAGAGFRVDLAPVPITTGTPAPRRTGAPRRRGYLGGFAAVLTQPVGEVDGHYLTEGVGGSGFGLGATAGAFVGRQWSLAAEVARGPEFEAESFFAGRIHYHTRYRDTLVSGLARWHRDSDAPLRVEPVFGGTVAAGHAPRTSTWITRWNSADEPADATVSRISFGAVGGADLVVSAKRLAAVASFRLHVLDRNDVHDDQPPELGVGRLVYIVAGGLRWTF